MWIRAQDRKTVVLKVRILCVVFYVRKIVLWYYHILYFSLRMVKSLQLCRCRQISKPCKYCLVWLFSLTHFFFYFLHLTYLEISCISHIWEFRTFIPFRRLFSQCFKRKLYNWYLFDGCNYIINWRKYTM